MWSAIKSFFATRSSGPSTLPVDPPSVAAATLIVALVGDGQDRQLLDGICHRNQWGLHFAGTCTEASEAADQLKAPIILCDRDLPGVEWRDAVRVLASSPHRACVILISKVVDDRLWNEVAFRGGYEILAKPLREDDVVRAVKLACSYWNSAMGMGS